MIPATLGDVVRLNAARIPEETAFAFGATLVTFAEHHGRALRLSAAIAAAGLGLQDRVAVLSRNTRPFMEIYAAGELAGYVVATINYRLAAPEVARIVADAAPAILFFETAFAHLLEPVRAAGDVPRLVAFGGEVPDFAEDYEAFLASGDPAGADGRPGPDDILHVIYTSGTTGLPKGVMRSHRAELAVAASMASEIGIEPGDRMQLMMPAFHVGARFLQIGAHFRGATVRFHAEFDPPAVVDAIERERITITHMAPTMVKMLLDVPGIEARDLSSLRTLVYSGAPMPLPLLERGLSLLGPVFLQLYGMSEGCATTLPKRQHRTATEADRRRLASVGQAAGGVEIRIADPADRPLPPGAVGEVQTRTPTLLSGYWNNGPATLAALRGGWYHTGDMGMLDENGFLFLVDRKKDMIISGGENIYSREVEAALASHPAVEDVAVIGVPDPTWGEAVVAVVVAREPRPSADVLVAHCRTQIASYKKLRTIHFVAELPRLVSGKVDKVALRGRFRPA